jgi:hypothetical protein
VWQGGRNSDSPAGLRGGVSIKHSHQAYFFLLRGLFIATSGAAAFLRVRRRAGLRFAAFLRAGFRFAAFLRAGFRLAVFLRAGFRLAVFLRPPAFLRAGLRRAAFLRAGLRFAVFLRPPALRAAFLRAGFRFAVFRAVDLRAVDLRAAFLRPVDLRRVERFAAFFGIFRFTSLHRSDDLWKTHTCACITHLARPGETIAANCAHVKAFHGVRQRCTARVTRASVIRTSYVKMQRACAVVCRCARLQHARVHL